LIGGASLAAPIVGSQAAGGEPRPSAGATPALSGCEDELRRIGAELQARGFTPTPDAEIRAAIARGDYDDVRFVVSIQKKKSHDEPVGYRRRDTGRTTMWTAPYDAIKAGDLSAPLLCAMIGTRYDPGAEYEMFILDKGPSYTVDGSVSLVPTFENLANVGATELAKDDPRDPVHDPAVLESAMTPEMQQVYHEKMHEFWAAAEKSGASEYKPDHIRRFAAAAFDTEEDAMRFCARHLYRTQIGANAWFRGDGATEFIDTPASAVAIARDGIEINGAPGTLGVPELLTIERNPPSISRLRDDGSIVVISLG
jgi:hypothetical protein